MNQTGDTTMSEATHDQINANLIEMRYHFDQLGFNHLCYNTGDGSVECRSIGYRS